MKFNSKNLWTFTFFILTSAFIAEGCNTQTPTASALAVSASDPYALVNIVSSASYPPYIDGGTYNAPSVKGATIGTHLIGHPSGGYVEAVSYSTPVTVSTGPTPFELIPSGYMYYNETFTSSKYVYTGGLNFSLSTVGFNSSVVPTGLTDGYDAYGINIVGLVNDPESPVYPPGTGNLDNVTFEVSPVASGSFYNVSAYQGIEFYIKIDLSDSAVDRQFLVNVEQTNPSSANGTCLSPAYPSLTKCYDAYLDDYTNLSKGQWILVQENWGDFKQYGFGSTTSPPTLTGTNLSQIAVFEWVESNTGNMGPMNIDYTISGIRFF